MFFLIGFISGILFTLLVQSSFLEYRRNFSKHIKFNPEYFKKHAEEFQHYSWSREQALDLDLNNESLYDISEFTIKKVRAGFTPAPFDKTKIHNLNGKDKTPNTASNNHQGLDRSRPELKIYWPH